MEMIGQLTVLSHLSISIAFESLDKSTDTLLYKLIFTALTFMLTWVLSDLSYNFYEKIFNRTVSDEYKWILSHTFNSSHK